MDDDIQFLGMVPPISPLKPSYAHPSHPSMQPPASGIMLVIPKSGDEPTQTLRFLKSRSAVVHIGRASSSLVDSDKSPDTIQFRCPVISRRHAKLMFSSGHVYIVDLHSHHGTHLLRRDELVHRPMVPDVPIALQDGDTLTFGKAVGKEPYLVSPVTANVMLIYDTEAVLSPSVSQPVISLVDSPTLPATPIKSKEHAEAPNPPNPGRYGLFGPQSTPSPRSSPTSSASEDFSQSDPDGDEDDEDDDYLDPPEEYPSISFGGHAQAQSSGACYASLPSLHGLGLLASRHVTHHAPPTHIPVHAPHTLLNMHSQMASSLTLERRHFIQPWSDSIQRPTTQDPANVTMEAVTDEPMDISRAASPPVANLLHDVPDGVIEEAFVAAAQTEAQINPTAEEPPIVGAYPGSPVRSVVLSLSPWEIVDELPRLGRQQESLCQPQGQQLGNPSPAPEGTSPSSIIVEASESSEQLVEDVASDVDADGEADIDPATATSGPSTGLSAPLEAGPLVPPAVTVVPQPLNTHAPAGPAVSATSGMTIDARLTSLDEALVNLWGNVLRMQIAHRKTQTDHKMLSDRTDALAARVDAVQADLRGAVRSDDEVEALRERVQAAEDLLSELQGRLSTAEAALAEAKAQQAEAQAQAAERAAKLVEAESDAAPAITTTITPPITPTRKRKRTEDDVGDVDEDSNVVHDREGKDEAEEEQGNSVVRACCPKVQARKRPRRLVRAAVQVTAAATIGAVAAWSALAFV